MRAQSLIIAGLLLAACAAGSAYEAPPPPPPQPSPPVTIADPVVPPLPAHRFYAREHAPREPLVPQAAALTSLPRMVTSGKCVAAGAVPEGRPAASGKRRTQKVAAGAVPYQPGSTRKPKPRASAPSTASPTAKAAPPATPALEAEPSASVDLDHEVASESAGADRAPATNIIEAERSRDSVDRQLGRRTRRAQRDARKSRRKAKRAHDRALAANREAQAPASMPRPPMDDEARYVEPPPPEPAWPPAEEGWGGATYLSNDDTMSLSSAQRVLFAIGQHLPIPPEHVRPHELLNYFSFVTAPVREGNDFSVRAELAPSRRDPGMLSLGLAVAGRPVGREGRRNAVLTLVIDRSGSMKAQGRMDFLKQGLLRMVRELKDGDIIHVVTFDHRVCTPLQNFVVGRDKLATLTRVIHKIRPAGSTNLHAGLTRGYAIADTSYQPRYTNRVVVITDALANKGITDARTLAMVSDWYDARRIRLSGIGVGREFNDALLDRLTEKGRGAYVFLGSESEVDAVFGARFTSLVETVANDVHFRLHLPPSLRMEAFHGEESSAVKREVQAVHFFADTSQLLLADLEPWQGTLREQDDLMLEIEYQHPETGQTMVEDHVLPLAEARGQTDNVRKAEVVMHFVDGIARQAARGAPPGWRPRAGSWRDSAAVEDCAQTRGELRELAAGGRDPEVAELLMQWDWYCTRFEGSGGRRPPRKGSDDRWPAASGR